MGLFNKKDNDTRKADARVTVARRESGGLYSFETWDFFLNGKNIGRLEDGATVTAASGKRINVLEARNPKRFVTETLKFFAESGAQAEAVFRAGEFIDPRGMSVILPAGEPGVSEKITENFNSNIWMWVYWAFLTGYYAGVFLLTRGQFLLALVLAIWPFIALTIFCRSAQKGMADYLSYNHLEAWGRISKEMIFSRWGFGLISYDGEIDDPYYDELRKRYKRVLCAQVFSLCAYLAACMYAAATMA